MITFEALEDGVLFEQQESGNKIYWVKGRVNDPFLDVTYFTGGAFKDLGGGGYLIRTNTEKIKKGWTVPLIRDWEEQFIPVNVENLL